MNHLQPKKQPQMTMKQFNPKDFSQPQRQSINGIVIMYMDTLQDIVRNLFLPLAVVLYRLDGSKMVWVVVGVLLLLVLIGFIAYLKYIYFTFYLDQEKQEFVIQKGVITKNKITIQLDKIQQVNINQSLIQKLVGVYSVDIDTAGSNKKEVSIRAVDNALALHLKQQLLSNEKTMLSTTIIEAAAVKPFLNIRLSTLFKVGITSNYGRSIALILGFIGSLYGSFQEVTQTIEVDEEQVTGIVNQGINYFSFSFFLLLILVLVLLINLVRTLVKYYGYKMTFQKGAIAIQHGLFAKKNTLLKPLKVQLTIVRQNFFQRKLRLFDVHLKQAAATDEVEEEGKKSSEIEIPGCQPDEKEIILRQLGLSNEPVLKTFLPNYRYLIKAILLGIILPVIITLLVALYIYSPLQAYLPWLGLYVSFVMIIVYFRFKNYRLLVNNDLIMIKKNAWDVQFQLLEAFKIQGITTQQYFWHQSADLVHLTFHTAAGDVGFHFANYSELKPWINYWLYLAERSQQNWM